MPTSAGILVFKRAHNQLYYLLSHPGGPFYKNKMTGVWGIPKGIIEGNENPFDAAKREFEEETNLTLPPEGYIELPKVRYKNGKTLLSWAIEVSDLSLTEFKSNTFEMEWPPKSGVTQLFSEIDQLVFVDRHNAEQKIHPVQLPLITFIHNLYGN